MTQAPATPEPDSELEHSHGRRRALGALLSAFGAGALLARAMAYARATTATAQPADERFVGQFGEAFFAAYWRLHTDAAVAVGYYAVAGQLNVPDAAYRRRYARFLTRALARLHALAPEQLSDARRADWLILENQLRYEQWSLAVAREWQWNPAQYSVAPALALILQTGYAPLEQRVRSALTRSRDVAAYYAAARDAITVPTRTHCELALEQHAGTQALFAEQLPRYLATAALPDAERAAAERALRTAGRALAAHGDWLQSLLRSGRATRAFRLGGQLYAQKFAFVHQSGDTAEALYQRAQQERAAVLARMAALARTLWPRYWPDRTPPAEPMPLITQVIDRLSDEHVSAAQFMPTIARLIPQLTQWVQAHALLDIDTSKPLQVRVTPEYERGIAIAGIEAPGPYDPSAATYFNVDPIDFGAPQRVESLLREYNRWMLPVFIMHEAVPGHYVQLMYANRAASRLQSVFGNGTMIEGWAVYSERMMLESGYDDSAEQWLMYWKWYLRSVTNTLLDYGVHVLGMDASEVHTLLTQGAFQSEQEARNKWLRVQRTSVQLTQYFAGFTAIYALRERQRAQQGAAFDLKQFHERFLGFGSAPVAVIASLMGRAVPGK